MTSSGGNSNNYVLQSYKMYFLIFLDAIWRPMQIALKQREYNTDLTFLHWMNSLLNQNVQALQHNYRKNIIPYFWLISPRTHNPHFKHTCHTHKHTPAVHSGTVRTDRRTPCHTPMTDKNSDLLDRTFPLWPGKKGGYLLWAENVPDHLECWSH